MWKFNHSLRCHVWKDRHGKKNPKNDCGETPLHYACRIGNLECVKILFETEEDYYLLGFGHLELCQFLIDRLRQHVVVATTHRQKYFVHPITINGYTPYLTAHKSGHYDIALFLRQEHPFENSEYENFDDLAESVEDYDSFDESDENSESMNESNEDL